MKMKISKEEVKQDPAASESPSPARLNHRTRGKNGANAQRKADKLAAISTNAEFIQDSSLEMISLV